MCQTLPKTPRIHGGKTRTALMVFSGKQRSSQAYCCSGVVSLCFMSNFGPCSNVLKSVPVHLSFLLDHKTSEGEHALYSWVMSMVWLPLLSLISSITAFSPATLTSTLVLNVPKKCMTQGFGFAVSLPWSLFSKYLHPNSILFISSFSKAPS